MSPRPASGRRDRVTRQRPHPRNPHRVLPTPQLQDQRPAQRAS